MRYIELCESYLKEKNIEYRIIRNDDERGAAEVKAGAAGLSVLIIFWNEANNIEFGLSDRLADRRRFRAFQLPAGVIVCNALNAKGGRIRYCIDEDGYFTILSDTFVRADILEQKLEACLNLMVNAWTQALPLMEEVKDTAWSAGAECSENYRQLFRCITEQSDNAGSEAAGYAEWFSDYLEEQGYGHARKDSRTVRVFLADDRAGCARFLDGGVVRAYCGPLRQYPKSSTAEGVIICGTINTRRRWFTFFLSEDGKVYMYHDEPIEKTEKDGDNILYLFRTINGILRDEGPLLQLPETSEN